MRAKVEPCAACGRVPAVEPIDDKIGLAAFAHDCPLWDIGYGWVRLDAWNRAMRAIREQRGKVVAKGRFCVGAHHGNHVICLDPRTFCNAEYRKAHNCRRVEVREAEAVRRVKGAGAGEKEGGA